MRRDDPTLDAVTQRSNGANLDDSTADGRVDDALDLVIDEVSEDVAEAVGEPGWRGIPHRLRSTPGGRLALKIVIGAVGGLVVLLGLFLIPFPGPGWLIVLAGLAILASEYAWARRLLHFTRSRLESWWHWMNRQSRPVRLLVGLAGALFVGAIVWLSVRVSFGIDLVAAALAWV